MLMMVREHLVGRFGIPKYGDPEEHPLQPTEIRSLRRSFRKTHRHFEDFVCFRLLNTYVLNQQDQYEPLMELNRKMDRFVFRYLPSSLNKYSYRQIIEVQK